MRLAYPSILFQRAAKLRFQPHCDTAGHDSSLYNHHSGLHAPLDNKPGLNKWIAVFIGFLGLVSLFYPFNIEFDKILSILAVSAGGFCFALALNMIKKLPDSDGLVSARNVLLASLVQLFLVGLFFDPFWNIKPTLLSTVSVLYLGAICTGIVYWLYFSLIETKGPTFASFSNYLVPVTGVILGVISLGDEASLRKIEALAIILVAVFISEMKIGNKA